MPLRSPGSLPSAPIPDPGQPRPCIRDPPTVSPIQTPSRQIRIRVRHWRVVAAVIAVALVAIGGLILISRPAGAAQKRTDFAAMVLTLRTDLAGCSTKASEAITDVRLTERGSDSVDKAEKAAQSAAQGCAPGTANAIFELTLYSVPTSLSGLNLNYAVSCLGVWAQEDVGPAFRNEKILLAHPGDQSAASAYRLQAGWAAANLRSANSILRRAAGKLGVADFSSIQLTSIEAVGLPRLRP